MAKSKTPKKNKKQTEKPIKKSSNLIKFLRVTLVLTLVSGVIVGLYFGCIFTFESVLWENPRLKLQHINIETSGWWQGRENRLCQDLNLKIGKMYLFSKSLRLSELRKKINAFANVKSAIVSRKLPDTLKINIVERIPRATIKKNSEIIYVVDSECIAIPHDKINIPYKNLPLILGSINFDKIKSGEKLPQLKPALDLIMLCRTKYTQFEINAINIINPEIINVTFLFNETRYQAKIPSKTINKSLSKLDKKILVQKQTGKLQTRIDLTYKNSVIFR